jgi:hypothetical protein
MDGREVLTRRRSLITEMAPPLLLLQRPFRIVECLNFVVLSESAPNDSIGATVDSLAPQVITLTERRRATGACCNLKTRNR